MKYYSICVSPDFQKAGLGSLLMNKSSLSLDSDQVEHNDVFQ